MAEHKVTYTIALKDMLSGGIKSAATSIKSFEGTLGKAKSGITGLVGSFAAGSLIASGIQAAGSALMDFASRSSEAYLESEKNNQMLRFSTEKVAGASAVRTQALMDEADALMYKTQFEDDDTKLAMTQLLNYGLTTDAVSKLTPQILDLAAATGKNLDEATEYIKKGIGGMGKGLKALGLNVTLTKDKEKNLALITQELTKYTGAAGEQFNTAAGQMAYYNNMLGESEEKFGQYTANVSLMWANFKGKMAEGIATIAKDLGTLWDRLNGGEVVDPAKSAIITAIDAEIQAMADAGATYKGGIKEYFKTKISTTKGEVEAARKQFQAALTKSGLTPAEYEEDITGANAGMFTGRNLANTLTGGMVATSYSHAKDALNVKMYENILNEAEAKFAKVEKIAAGKLAITASAVEKNKIGDEDFGDLTDYKATKDATYVKGNTPTNINITIGDLIKEFSINTTNLKESASAIKEEVAKVLIGVVNDANLIPTK